MGEPDGLPVPRAQAPDVLSSDVGGGPYGGLTHDQWRAALRAHRAYQRRNARSALTSRTAGWVVAAVLAVTVAALATILANQNGASVVAVPSGRGHFIPVPGHAFRVPAPPQDGITPGKPIPVPPLIVTGPEPAKVQPKTGQ